MLQCEVCGNIPCTSPSTCELARQIRLAGVRAAVGSNPAAFATPGPLKLSVLLAGFAFVSRELGETLLSWTRRRPEVELLLGSDEVSVEQNGLKLSALVTPAPDGYGRALVLVLRGWEAQEQAGGVPPRRCQHEPGDFAPGEVPNCSNWACPGAVPTKERAQEMLDDLHDRGPWKPQERG